jgi:hypothetical protein
MKRVWAELRAGRSRVAGHQFFEWLNSDSVPLERRFVFSPVMIDFIMGFADLNKWFLSYPEPQNELERAINEHTQEDRTHSRLFYENWYTLSLGELAAWTPGKMLWWLFHSRDAEIVRRFGMDLLRLSARHADPLVRFPMMEAIEICGDVFFGHTAPIAAELSKKHNLPHDYYGKYHRDRETGHLQADEAPLLRASLSPIQLAEASRAVEHVFTMFCAVLDQLLDYGQRSADYRKMLLELDGEHLDAIAPPLHASTPAVRSEVLDPPPSAPPSLSQLAVLRHLQEKMARLRQHPLLTWLRSTDDVDPRDRLRGFVALWGVDIAGYKDFNELVLHYAEPQTPLEQALNEWTANLASHGGLFLRDWQALKVDEVLSWDAGETIAFYFLGNETEVHRRNMAKVKHRAFRNENPLVRFWLIKALEDSGEALFSATAPLAQAVEAQEQVTLDYWAHRHQLAEVPGSSSPQEIATLFLAQPLTAEQRSECCEIIDTIFENMAEQFDLSLATAWRQKCVRHSRTLPPSRSSMIAARAVGADELAADTEQRAG